LLLVTPKTKPRISPREVGKIIERNRVVDPVVLVGIRGYYLRTMGDPTRNDRGLWDDAMILVSPEVYATFNANTDPSIYRTGIASLMEGVHRYRRGNHGIGRGPGYPALRPATTGERLPVRRDGREGIHDGVAINIHRGGSIASTSPRATSSEGCQTIPREQWEAFINLVYSEMRRHGQQTVPYVLTAAPSA
jgi:lysozyme